MEGKIEEKYLEDNSDIYVAVRDMETQETRTYQAFYKITEDGKGNGYKLYLKGTSVPQGEFHISVITENSGQAKIVASKDIKWE